MLDFFFYLAVVLFIIVCSFLMLLILIQKGRGGGLSSAFGGGGGNTAFGSKTGDVLTWATSVVFGVFLVLSVGLNLLADAKTTPPPAPSAVVPTTPPPGAPPAAPGPITDNPIQAAKENAGLAEPTAPTPAITPELPPTSRP